MTTPAERARWRTIARRRKYRALVLYGLACAACGERELACLTLDHIDDSGAQRRREGDLSGSRLYQQINATGRREDLQCLCANCQARKRVYGPDPATWKNKQDAFKVEVTAPKASGLKKGSSKS